MGYKISKWIIFFSCVKRWLCNSVIKGSFHNLCRMRIVRHNWEMAFQQIDDKSYGEESILSSHSKGYNYTEDIRFNYKTSINNMRTLRFPMIQCNLTNNISHTALINWIRRRHVTTTWCQEHVQSLVISHDKIGPINSTNAIIVSKPICKSVSIFLWTTHYSIQSFIWIETINKLEFHAIYTGWKLKKTDDYHPCKVPG